MKTFVMLLLTVVASGCVSASKLARELAKDPATVHVSIRSIYVNIEIDRANPMTNSLPHSVKDGAIVVGKQ